MSGDEARDARPRTAAWREVARSRVFRRADFWETQAIVALQRLDGA